jgi:hypothetical protein
LQLFGLAKELHAIKLRKKFNLLENDAVNFEVLFLVVYLTRDKDKNKNKDKN